MVRQGQVLKEGKRFRVEEPRPARAEPEGRRKGRKEPVPTRQESTQVEGTLSVHRDGYGFVRPLSGEGEDVFLPPGEASRALDKDRVVVEVSGQPGRFEGRLVRVVE